MNERVHRGYDFEELYFLCLSHPEMNVETRLSMQYGLERYEAFSQELDVRLSYGDSSYSPKGCCWRVRGPGIASPDPACLMEAELFARARASKRTAVLPPFPGHTG